MSSSIACTLHYCPKRGFLTECETLLWSVKHLTKQTPSFTYHTLRNLWYIPILPSCPLPFLIAQPVKLVQPAAYRCLAIHQSMNNIWASMLPKTDGFLSSISHQMSTASQPGTDFMSPWPMHIKMSTNLILCRQSYLLWVNWCKSPIMFMKQHFTPHCVVLPFFLSPLLSKFPEPQSRIGFLDDLLRAEYSTENCGGPQMWILTENQRVQTYSCSSKVIQQDVLT